MNKMRKASFEAPRRASASHLIHLIGIDNFREELAKQQKAKADGILEVITATSIRRASPATKREQEMMNVACQMHFDGKISDLTWSQIRAIFVYLGADKDKNGYIELNTIIFPDDWDPAQDLAFAKRLLPKFLHYQLQEYKELGQSIDHILDKAGTLKGASKKQSDLDALNLRREEELANWNLIKDSDDKRDFQTFLNHYKGGAYERLAYIKLEEIEWQELGSTPTYQHLYHFLQSFPYGRHADEAKVVIQKIAAKEAKERSFEKSEKIKASAARAQRNKERLQHIFAQLKSYIKRIFSAVRKKQNITIVETEKNYDKSSKLASSPLMKSLAAGVIFSIACIVLLSAPFWKQEVGEKEIRTFVGHTKSLKAVAFLPNGKEALSASADHTLKLWNIRSGRAIRTFKGHDGIVSSLAISPDGKTAISGSHDNTVKLWNLSTGQLLDTFQGHANWVVSVAFSDDGDLALSGSHDKTIKLWHVASGKLLRTFMGHKDWVIAVSFVADTNAIISGSHDRTLRLWDIGNGKNVRTFVGHKDWVTSLTASRYNLTALSGSYDKTLRLWNMKTGEANRTFDKLRVSGITSVALSPNEKIAITSFLDKRIILWDVSSGKKLRVFRGHKTADTNSVAISPDGQFALSAGDDKTLKLWRLVTLAGGSS